MPDLRSTSESWARLAVAALYDPTPGGLVRGAVAEAIRRRHARPAFRGDGRSPHLDPQRLAREVGRRLEPFLEREATGGLPDGSRRAVHHAVESLLRRHAPDARRINGLLRDPGLIAREILHLGRAELTGLGPHTEIPLVRAIVRHTYRLLLRQPAVLDALRPDHDLRLLRQGERILETLEEIREE